MPLRINSPMRRIGFRGIPANRFGLGKKGRIAPGFDADLSVVKFGEFPAVTAEDLATAIP